MIVPGTAERFWKAVRQHVAEYAGEYLPHLVPVEVTEVDATTGWVKVKYQGRDTAVGGFRPVLSSEATLAVADIAWALAVGSNLLVLGKAAEQPFTGGGGGASSLNGLSDVDTATDPPATGEVLKYNGTLWVPQADDSGGGGVTDHGALTGLADDDHPQYALDTDLDPIETDVAALQTDVTALEGDVTALETGKLDATSAAVIAEFTGTPDGTKYLRDDGTLATPSGGGGSETTGVIKMYGGSSAPSGYLICDGSAVSRTTYAALYTALGGASSPFGQGDGSTTFNLPDMRGRVPVGVGTGDASDATAHTLGEKEGTETHALTTAQLPPHSHVTGFARPGRGAGSNGTLTSAGSDSNITSNDTGSGSSHPNMQPSLSINFIIKT